MISELIKDITQVLDRITDKLNEIIQKQNNQQDVIKILIKKIKQLEDDKKK